MPLWTMISYACWGISGLLVLWMFYDWIKTDSAHSEAELTSSREGEIEALSEKHKI